MLQFDLRFVIALAVLACCPKAFAGTDNARESVPASSEVRAVAVYLTKQSPIKRNSVCTMDGDSPEARGWSAWPAVVVVLKVKSDGSVESVVRTRQVEGATLSQTVLDALARCASTAIFDDSHHETGQYIVVFFVQPGPVKTPSPNSALKRARGP
jgi:hypothetical protein